jgi:phosphate transport system protein
MPTREVYNRQLRQIQDEVLLLGSMVEQAMLNAVDALKRRDIQAAKKIYHEDSAINEKRFAIENAVLILIATQAPMAHDLRMLAAILEIITELERMGDYAKGIGRVVVRLGEDPIPTPQREISRMAELAVSMLHRALSAFVIEDIETASRIPREDDEVDALYTQTYHQVVASMIANPEIIDRANLLMWVVHNLERMADRVTNICERTVFVHTGELLEYDTTEDEDEE